MNNPRVVILVPYRGGDTVRAMAWQFTFKHLEGFGWPIYSADSTGDWNRSEAINRSSRAADEDKPWDIAVIADADTIHKPDEFRNGVAWAAKLQTLVVPWQIRHKLSPRGSENFYERGISGFEVADLDLSDPTRRRMPVLFRGGTTVVPRTVWERVGGFDEGFVGWGHEDVAFRVAASTLTPGRVNELTGTIWHLHHARDPHHENRKHNDERRELYLQANGNRVRMMELLQQLEVVSA